MAKKKEEITVSVKMFIVDYSYHSYEDDSTIISGVTDWEELSQKDYFKVLDWVNAKNLKTCWQRDKKYHLVQKVDQINVPSCIAEYKELMKEEIAAKEEAKAKKEKAAATRKKNKIKKEKQKLKELQDKYGK